MATSQRNFLTTLQPWLLCISVVLVIAGLALGENPVNSYWRTASTRGLVTWIIVSGLCFFLLRKLASSKAHLLALAAVSAFLLLGSGPIQAVVCIIFLGSSYVLGNLLYARLLSTEGNTNSPVLSLILGFSCYLLILMLAIHWPINYVATYWALLLAPIITLAFLKDDQKRLIEHTCQTITVASQQLSAIPYYLWAMTLMLLGYVGSFAFVPTIMADDIGYHLAMWTQLDYHHKFLFDVKTQVWSTAPFASDALHGFLSLCAGDDARGARNLIFYGLLLLTLTKISTQIFSKPTHTLAVIALFASTPLIANLLVGLQVELILTLLTTVGIYCLCTPNLSVYNRLLAIFLIGCMLIAVKLPAGLLAVALGICFIFSYGRDFKGNIQFNRSNAVKALIFGLLGLAIAVNCYISAYIYTGNPTFPLYNAIFQSPYYHNVNLADATYRKGASFSAYWGVFFNTTKYFESFNFCAGFQYLTLPFIGAFYLFNRKKGIFLHIVLPIILFGGTMFYLMQYWRYLLPVMPAASILIGCALIPLQESEHKKYIGRISAATLVFLITMNIYFLPAISWLFYSNQFKFISPSAKDAFTLEHFAEHALNKYMNQNHPGESVLPELSRPAGTTLWGKSYYAVWSSPSTLKKFDEMKGADDLLQFLKENDIHYVYWDENPVPNAFYFRDFIAQVVAEKGIKETSSKNISLYRIDY